MMTSAPRARVSLPQQSHVRPSASEMRILGMLRRYPLILFAAESSMREKQ
jgi:hypothetical protein